MGQLLIEYFGDPHLEPIHLICLRKGILIPRLCYFRRLVDLRDFVVFLVIVRSFLRYQNSEKDQCCLLRIAEDRLIKLVLKPIDSKD